MQYNKFEFRDFNRGTVIRTPPKDEVQAEIEQIVTNAVVDALQENIGNVEDKVAQESSEEKMEESQPAIDIDSIRAESYQNGYNDAKMHFEPLIKGVKEDESLVQVLKSKLEAILPVVDIKEQTLTLSTKALVEIAKKLHLAIPTDFESIILGEMTAILNKYYKTGEITITVHPEKVDYCQNLLKISTLPTRISENVQIVPEDTMGKGDCTLRWKETELEYSQGQIIEDTDAILEHLKV